MHKTLSLLLIFCFSSIYSQSKIDSLKEALRIMKKDSSFVVKALTIGTHYMRVDLDSAMAYYNWSEELSEQIDNQLLWGIAKYRKGNVHRRNSNVALATAEYDTALKIFKHFKDLKWLASIKTEMASLAANQQKTEDAVVLYLEALEYAKANDDANEEARIYNYLGTLYRRQKQYEKAIENYEQALSLVKRIDFRPGISACLTNLAAVHNELGNHGEAITYSEEALALKEKMGDKLGASRVLGNLGSLYQSQTKYAISNEYYKRALDQATEVGEQKTRTRVSLGLARNAYHLKEYEACIVESQNILQDLKNISDLKLNTEVHGLISNAYEELNDHKNALLYSRKHEILKDSLYDENRLKLTADLEGRYKNEQQQKEIAILAAERDLQALQISKRITERNIIIAFSILALIVLGLLFNQYLIKRKANSKLKELDNLKSTFFTNVSHEFRTPLTIIMGMTKEMLENKTLRSQESLEMILRNTNYLHQLINQLLDLSKIESGGMQLLLKQADIVPFLRYITGSFQSHAYQKSIAIHFNTAHEEIYMDFDSEKILKIVSNLLSNAIKFSNSGSAIYITTRLETTPDSSLKIKIKDHGIGIAKNELPYIFDRFYQASSSSGGSNSGSGIGLALTRQLVELLHGHIDVRSQIGEGTEFTVTLPVTNNSPISKLSEDEHLNESLQGYLSSAPRWVVNGTNEESRPELLIVEDNEDVANFLILSLNREYVIKTARNGSEGLKKAIEHIPDIIISDVMMPKMDGFQLCEKIKTDFRTSHIPVILLTAKADQQAKIAGLQHGADAYLTKPFDKEELLTRLRKLHELRLMLQRKFSLSGSLDKDLKFPKTSLEEQFLAKVNGILEEHLDEEDFGITSLCATYGISRVQLHRKLKALTQLSASHYIRRYKLIRAKEMILSTEMNISEIAYAVGFKSPAYFSQVFSEVFGFPPSEMRPTSAS